MRSKLEVIEITILGMPWRVFAVTIVICTLIYMSWSVFLLMNGDAHVFRIIMITFPISLILTQLFILLLAYSESEKLHRNARRYEDQSSKKYFERDYSNTIIRFPSDKRFRTLKLSRLIEPVFAYMFLSVGIGMLLNLVGRIFGL